MKNVVFFAFLLIVGEQVLTKPFRTGNEQIILDEFQAAIDDHQARARQEFETEGSLPLNGELTGDLIQKVEATAGKVTGPQQLMIQATARYLKKLQKREQSYSEASLSFDVEEIIPPSALTDRSQLLPYRQSITNFMKANEELKQFTLHSAAHFEAELLQAEIPRASLNHALKGFKSSSAPQLGTLTEIRDQDAALGTNLLAVLDLYDSQWNRWHYDSEAEIAVFQDPASGQAYTTILDTIISLSEQQQKAQEKLLNIKH